MLFYNNKDGAGKGNHQYLGNLVTKPNSNLKDAREIFKSHEKCEYHKHYILVASNLSVVNKKQDCVHLQIDKNRKAQCIENRKKLLPIIQTIRLCGRQQIALRGKDDSERISLEEPLNNDGNFRFLLRFRANSGDSVLKDHLEHSGGEAMYTSSVIQNELITTFGELVQKKKY